MFKGTKAISVGMLLLTLLLITCTPTLATVTWQQTNGQFGDTIFTLVVDPTNTQVIYAVAPTGVYKTSDGGNSWKAANNGLPPNISSLDPVDWERISSFAIDTIDSQKIFLVTESGGVFRSTNGGESWSQISQIEVRLVGPLAMDPTDSQVLYLGMWGGPWKSTDGGITWNRASSFHLDWCTALIVSPSTNATIYIAGEAEGIGVLQKSINGGESWESIKKGLNVERIRKEPKYDPIITALAIEPNKSKTIYAGTIGDDVFKSTNGAISWSALKSPMADFYVTSLVIDPINSKTIFAGTESGLFMSTDAGNSWSAVSSGLTDTNVTSLALDPSNPQIIYVGTASGYVFKGLVGTDHVAN